MSRWLAAIGVVVLTTSPAMAQDVKTVLASASKAMGVDGLNSVHYYGVAADYTVGQNNNANGAWPRRNLDDYDRTIDFTQPASRATAVTYAVPVTGGAAAQGAFNQNITPANNTWAQQLEIWTTPWGFIKGAMTNNATARSQTVNGKRYTEVTWMTTQKTPSGSSYKVVGYINPQTNLVEKVDTWLEHPFFGDMYIENLYTEYRDGNGGIKFPSTIQQKRVGRPTFDFQVLAAFANPSNLQQLMTPPARGGGPGGPPPAGAAAGRGGNVTFNEQAGRGGAPGGGGGAPGAGAGRGGPGGPGGPGGGAP